MEERRRGFSVAAETPPPLLGLVAFAVLPPSGCCSATKELEGSTPCHQFESVYDLDSDDELQWLNEMEMATSRTRSLIWKLHKLGREQLTGLIMLLELSISSRYNDLMLRIFSKHPDLFPEEVSIIHGKKSDF
nr:uncharacterized protein LOC112728132 isoform X4 [Arachis hypogaea]